MALEARPDNQAPNFRQSVGQSGPPPPVFNNRRSASRSNVAVFSAAWEAIASSSSRFFSSSSDQSPTQLVIDLAPKFYPGLGSPRPLDLPCWALQLHVLVLQRPQPLGLRDVHPSEFSLPFVDAGVADAMLAAESGDRDPGLVLFQNPDDLSFRKPFALHALVLVLGQSELQTGLSPRGKVIMLTEDANAMVHTSASSASLPTPTNEGRRWRRLSPTPAAGPSHLSVVLPKRWIVERIFAWISRNRRLARDFERYNQNRPMGH